MGDSNRLVSMVFRLFLITDRVVGDCGSLVVRMVRRCASR